MATATKARLGIGTKVEIDPAGGSTFQEVIEPIDLGDIGETGDFVDVTNLDSPDATREFIAGLKTPPDKTLTFRDVPEDTGQIALKAAAVARSTIAMRITLPPKTPAAPTVATFQLVLAGYVVSSPAADGALNIVVSGKQSGAVTWTNPA